MNIRLMQSKDYSQVYALWASDGNVGLRNLDDSPEGIDRFLKRNPTTCFVAVSEDNIIGAILCGHDARRAYIYHAFVHQDFRSKGIGKKLVEKVLGELEELGITKVALTVYSSNEPGNKFWENMGFIRRPDLFYRNKTLNPDNE